jgi:hypothetical protein
VGMFLDKADPNPRKGVHLLWAGAKVRPENPFPSPDIDQRVALEEGKQVVTLDNLIRMKLMAYRDQDRVHLRDMIEVGLVDRSTVASLPDELNERLDLLLKDMGR